MGTELDDEMPSQVICISHLTGAGGESIGQIVAERLGFQYLDDEIIERAAELVSLDPAVIGSVERRRSLVSRFLHQLGDAGAADTQPRVQASSRQIHSHESGRELPVAEDIRALIREVIGEAAQEGNVVIVSHAASMALAGRDDVLRVLVTASPETRARRVASTRNLDARKAARVVKAEDDARADYLKRFHRIDRELPTHYDLVVNTDVLMPDRAADLVVLAGG
jgi:cytidylate kinase